MQCEISLECDFTCSKKNKINSVELEWSLHLYWFHFFYAFQSRFHSMNNCKWQLQANSLSYIPWCRRCLHFCDRKMREKKRIKIMPMNVERCSSVVFVMCLSIFSFYICRWHDNKADWIRDEQRSPQLSKRAKQDNAKWMKMKEIVLPHSVRFYSPIYFAHNSLLAQKKETFFFHFSWFLLLLLPR